MRLINAKQYYFKVHLIKQSQRNLSKEKPVVARHEKLEVKPKKPKAKRNKERAREKKFVLRNKKINSIPT